MIWRIPAICWKHTGRRLIFGGGSSMCEMRGHRILDYGLGQTHLSSASPSLIRMGSTGTYQAFHSSLRGPKCGTG